MTVTGSAMPPSFSFFLSFDELLLSVDGDCRLWLGGWVMLSPSSMLSEIEEDVDATSPDIDNFLLGAAAGFSGVPPGRTTGFLVAPPLPWPPPLPLPLLTKTDPPPPLFMKYSCTLLLGGIFGCFGVSGEYCRMLID